MASVEHAYVSFNVQTESELKVKNSVLCSNWISVCPVCGLLFLNRPLSACA